MNSIQDQSTTVGTTDGASAIMESEASTYTDKVHDLEASPVGDEQIKEELGDGKVGEQMDGVQGPTDDASATKDFPDLTPSKSMDFPDGGKKAWLTVAGGYLCLFCSFGFINAVGVFQTYYEQNQLSDHSAFQIGWISSFLVFCMNLGGVIVGPLFDIFGPHWLLIVGTIATTFGLMMTSLCHEYYQFFLAQSVVTGLGLSLIFQTAILCTNTWFLKKRGLAMGIVVSGSSLGGVCFPIMLKRLFDSVGFGWAVRAAGFLIFGCLTVANFLVRSRLPPPGWHKGRQIFDFEALREPVFALMSCACFFVYWGLFTPFTFITTYAISYGVDENLSFYLISIMNAASIVGRILPGVLADRAGPYNVQVIFTTVMAISILAYWTPSSNEAAIITFGLFYGFVSGGFISLFTVCCAMISPIKKIGGRFGLLSGFNGIAALTGIPISGALLKPGTWSNGFGPMILFSGLSVSIGAAFYTAARIKMVGWKLNVKR